MSSNSSPASSGHRADTPSSGHSQSVSPSDIAVGVIIGRTSEFFDFFVFAIASVIVFPARIFSFTDPLTGTLLSFLLLALAFVARPVGTALFTAIDRRHGRVTKLTVALFLMGTSTVAMGLIPEDQAMGFRMMLGAFTVPAGDDVLTSKIEFKDDGMYVNGQKMG